jgi:ABC-type transport system involved in Fe-S cluster assembly fused permease/ATPase subunit
MAAAAALTTLSKGAGVAAPLELKAAVDALAAGGAGVDAAVAAVARFTLLKVVSSVAREAKSPAFTPVAQAAARRVAYGTFAHVLALDAAYHTARRTGALARVLERGSRSVAMIFRAVVWTFVPTALELAAVCGLLAARFSLREAAAVAATFAAYTAWTVALTRAAVAARARVNALDAAARGRAVDALANVDAVQSFDAVGREAAAYDGLLVGYQAAAVATENLSAALNAGQATILALGMGGVTAMIAATPGATPGDLVMANGLLLQVAAPLSFLGWFWRELRQSLVDVDEFFGILRTR